MQHFRRISTCVILVLAALILVLDSKTAVTGASDAVTLCLRTVIPSLFPFFMISALLTGHIAGRKTTLLRPIGKVCAMPRGSESLLLLGFMGGYPVGAKNIYDVYKSKYLSRQSAKRLLGFCSNAGPAFIFGIISTQFNSPAAAWLIWLVHILSAVTVGAILPKKTREQVKLQQSAPQSAVHAMQSSILAAATVCGWVIIFRILLVFLDKWFLHTIQPEIRVLFSGILELTNGCVALHTIDNESVRFMICCTILGFGGVCVAMQTAAVTGELGTGMYLPGKLLHAAISTLFAAIIQLLVSPVQFYRVLGYISISCIFLLAALAYFCRKKSSSVRQTIVV